jgi:DNA invertase Pin-like site-specific DNA recombinase
LQEALAACRLHKATLVIARLDRLSRNASFLLNLQASGVRFVAVDLPHADNFTVGILAMVAQKEREMISQRTKDALAAAKRRGVKLGGDRGNLHLVRHKASAAGVASRNAKADAHAADLAPIIKEQMSSGQSLRGIASTLNDKCIPTPRGSTWTAVGVARVIKRLGL